MRVSPSASDAGQPLGDEAPARLQRFVRQEILLHWAVVVPYLLLALSGGTLSVCRLASIEFVSRTLCLRAHEASGVALLVLPLLVLVFSAPGPFVRTALEALRFGPRDIWWLHASALSLLFPRIRRPREGRFNAGQKLNILHVLLLVPAIAGTGILLWCGLRSALLVYTLHVSGAAVSFALACGHAYLALLHPTTRAARGAMLDGHVCAHYAAAHHPAWYQSVTGRAPKAQPSCPRPLVSRLGSLVAIVAIASLLLAAATLSLDTLGDRAHDALDGAWNRFAALAREPRRVLLPAPLADAHAAEKALQSCSGCHGTLLEGATRARCLSCHDEVARRLDARAGYHGKLAGECGDCHPDHREALITLLDESFQHDQALYRLESAHRDVPCASCHARASGAGRRYLGIAHASCSACHDDPHGRSRAECEVCHPQAVTWKAAGFDHDRQARFRLDSRHRTVACARCHLSGVAPVFRFGAEDDTVARQSFRCVACHEAVERVLAGDVGEAERPARVAPSVHHGKLACEDCHRVEEGDDGLAAATERCSHCHPADYDALFVDWRARIEVDLLDHDPAAARVWRVRSAHHWEGVLAALRERER